MARENLINISLNRKSDIDKAIKQLEQYKRELDSKTQEFVNRLAEIGITVASSYVSATPYDQYITFSTTDETSGDEIAITVHMSDTTKITSEWWHGGKLVQNDVSPIMMAEFGAGWLAEVKDYSGDIPTAGRGTNSLFGHGNEDNWYWTDKSGQHHSARDENSIAEMTPTHPIYNAVQQMKKSINKVAREVFE